MMKHQLPTLLIALALTSLWGCSSNTAGCKFDVDCPGALRCVDGQCLHPDDPCFEVHCQDGLVCRDGTCVDPQTDPCRDVSCDPGQTCVDGGCVDVDPCRDVECDPGQVCDDGDCVDANVDADGDGYPVGEDCDDSDNTVHPGAPEICNERDDDCDDQTDEGLFCGGDCAEVGVPPAVSPPAACDSATPCETCYRYEATNYFCRALGAGAYAWVAVPQATPCTSTQHCQTMVCAGSTVFHCDARVGAYVEGTVPTAEAEACNLVDDDCDGETDEAGAEDACPAREHGQPACTAGECLYTCDPGFHPCGDLCADDGSPETCGGACDPCPPVDNGAATCVAGACDFTCQSGFQKDPAGCLPCDHDGACGPSCAPCAAGTTCCGDGCYNLLNDPLHCGDCIGQCQDAGWSCCSGEGCCSPTYPQCCGQSCCTTTEQCCPGEFCCEQGGACCSDYCCGAASPICCGPGCCASGSSCCNDVACCNTDYPTCCPDGCCPAGYGVCCGPGCCQDGSFCCNAASCCQATATCCTDGCCAASSPVCCGDGCCPSGTYCCNNETACCSRGPDGRVTAVPRQPLDGQAPRAAGGRRPTEPSTPQ